MTPNKQEEMEKDSKLDQRLKSFNELLKTVSEWQIWIDDVEGEIAQTVEARAQRIDVVSREELFEVFTLQQEKVEKLEKVVKDQEKERQGAEAFWKRRLEIHQREIDSLKSDLDWATNLISFGSLEYSNHNDCCNKEIRLRHNLDKSEEV